MVNRARTLAILFFAATCEHAQAADGHPTTAKAAGDEQAAIAQFKTHHGSVTLDASGVVVQASVSAPPGVNEVDLSIVGHFKRLEEFRFDKISSGPVRLLGLQELREAARLTSLSITNARFDGNALQAIAKLKTIRDLELVGCATTDADLRRVAGLVELRSLNVRGNREITDAGIAHLVALTRLQTLGLENSGVTDGGLGFLAKLPALRQLRLHWTKVRGPGLAALRDSRLESVAGVGASRRDALPYLKLIRSLKRLNLSYQNVRDDDLRHIAELVNLEELTLDRNALTDAGLVHLAGLKRLRVLDLHCDGITKQRITDAGIAPLKSLTRLRDLNLRGMQLTTTGLAVLQAMKDLERLDISHTSLAKETQIDLRSLTKLKLVDAYGLDDVRVLVPPGCRVDTLE